MLCETPTPNYAHILCMYPYLIRSPWFPPLEQSKSAVCTSDSLTRFNRLELYLSGNTDCLPLSLYAYLAKLGTADIGNESKGQIVQLPKGRGQYDAETGNTRETWERERERERLEWAYKRYQWSDVWWPPTLCVCPSSTRLLPFAVEDW